MSFFYKKILQKALFTLDAETAHELGLNALRAGLASGFARSAASSRFAVSPFGDLKRFGLSFSNPLGVAAGFDKNGVAVRQLAALGFGFVEVGTVTLKPQKGNDKPRLFRLLKDQALINRLGFNNQGAAEVAKRLSKIKKECVVGVNIGKNWDVPDEEVVENYLQTFETVYSVADYVVVNVSSPNTPNLRNLQDADKLDSLVGALQKKTLELSNGGKPKPLLVKIAPDLTEGEIKDIADICVSNETAGVIATNTTISRDGLQTENVERFGPGGVSGRPLAKRSNDVIRSVFRHSEGRLPIIGVGGIFDGQDAYDKVAAGACLLQAYTGFVWKGLAFARDVNLELANVLRKKGFERFDDAIGSQC